VHTWQSVAVLSWPWAFSINCTISLQAIAVFGFQTSTEERSLRSFQISSVEQLPLELKLLINAEDQQLLKVALTLYEYAVAGFLRRNRLHLDKLAPDSPAQEKHAHL
jgi:hypothetical protein